MTYGGVRPKMVKNRLRSSGKWVNMGEVIAEKPSCSENGGSWANAQLLQQSVAELCGILRGSTTRCQGIV